jgi:hypothetical protein
MPGTVNNFVIYQDEVRGAIVERLTQASNYFNSVGGAIRLSTVSRRGDFYRESFFREIANSTNRRVTTAVTAVADLPLNQGEHVSVKLNRRYGPIANTLDSFRKIEMAAGENSLSFLIGTQAAKRMEVDMLNSVLAAGRAAVNNQTGTSRFVVPTNGTLNTAALISGLSLMGDAANNIVAWVMHSKAFFDLMQFQVNAATSGGEIALTSLAAGNPLTLNRPVIITDSPALIATGTPNDYITLGLTPDALVVEDSEETLMHSEIVTGLENLVVRLQGEYAFNVGVKGFRWNTATGANPTDAALATGANWPAAMTSHKDFAGIVIQSR